MTTAPTEADIEAAARAIDAHWSHDTDRDYPFEDTEPVYQQHCRDTARAALTAVVVEPAVVCIACGQPWQDGMSCGQKDNGHPFPVCSPISRTG